MTIYEHMAEFAGLPVVDWTAEQAQPLSDLVIPRISVEYGEADAGIQWVDRFAALLATPGVATLRGLVVGAWDSSMSNEESVEAVIEALVNAHTQLPNLRALFIGDIISEEAEISWIQQGDVSPLFSAFPALEVLGLRGGQQLELGTIRHAHLQTLIIQSGGLGANVVRAVAAAELPELTHLELWLGSDEYGGDATVDDLAPILAGDHFPKLVYLGLRDSEASDDLAIVLATAPVVAQVRVLDLSLGTLGDAGAAALLAAPAVAKLEKLDIHHHYCSPAMVAQLSALGITVDADDPQQEDEYDGEAYRYAAVTE